jgi:hypothetical protein
MKKKRLILKLFLLLTIIISIACSKEDDVETNNIASGNDPNFKIVKNEDKGLKSFNRKVVVFGIDIYAVKDVEDKKLLHAANVLAQYLDNDEDGSVDNDKVVNKMKEEKAFVVMWKTNDDIEGIQPPSGRMGQDLGNDETQPDFVKNGRTGTFDAAIEEIWHIITNAGYAKAYPQVFGEDKNTELTKAMDKARGGQFDDVPENYPDNAWYTYDDETCDYNCQASEYIYWGMSSILGAQEYRFNEIQNEWKLNTKEKVQQTDTDLYALLSDEAYKFPKKLPDGTYKR